MNASNITIHLTAIRSMCIIYNCDTTPFCDNMILFQVTTRCGRTPLTDSVARKHLKQVSIMLNTPKILTFHDFRRAGATWAFRHGVPVQEIQAQGTWFYVVFGGTFRFPLHSLLQFPLLFRGTYLLDAAFPYPYLALGAVLTPL